MKALKIRKMVKSGFQILTLVEVVQVMAGKIRKVEFGVLRAKVEGLMEDRIGMYNCLEAVTKMCHLEQILLTCRRGILWKC